MALNCIAEGKFGIAGRLLNWEADKNCINWYWNWGATPNTTGVEFVPVKFSLWWPSTEQVMNQSSPYVLTWNEPNHKEQSNINPNSTAAHQQWKDLYATAKIATKQLGSPQVARGAGFGIKEWIIPFFSNVCPRCIPADNSTQITFTGECCEYMPDFITTHQYFNNADRAIKELNDVLAVFPGLPMWITEFGLWQVPAYRGEKILFDFIERIKNKKEIFRASWYIYTTLKSDPAGSMYYPNGTLTQMGKRYRDIVNVAELTQSTSSVTASTSSPTAVSTLTIVQSTETIATTTKANPTTEITTVVTATESTNEVTDIPTEIITTSTETTEYSQTTEITAPFVTATESTNEVTDITTETITASTEMTEYSKTPEITSLLDSMSTVAETSVTVTSTTTETSYTVSLTETSVIATTTTPEPTSTNCVPNGKFGVAGSLMNWEADINCLTWHWAWGVKPKTDLIEFVPTKFSLNSPPTEKVINFTSPYVLAWNEPMFDKQGNVSATSPLSHQGWKDLYFAAKSASKLLGTPQLTKGGGLRIKDWAIPFYSGVCPRCAPADNSTQITFTQECCDYMPDFLVIHQYFTNADAAIKELDVIIELFPGLPVWITEFGLWQVPAYRGEKILFDYISKIEKRAEVVRASWFIYTTLKTDPAGSMYFPNGTLTQMGKRYRDTVNVVVPATTTLSEVTLSATQTLA